MVFELNLIGVKLVLEKALVDLLWLYYTSPNILLIKSDAYHFALSKLYTEPVLSTKFLYKGSYIDAAYQVSFHLAKQFQRRFFF
jgi:hypothetical protein